MAKADYDDVPLDVKSWLKRTYKTIPQNKAISGSEVQDLDENCKFPAHPWLAVDELKSTYKFEADNYFEHLTDFGKEYNKFKVDRK